MRSGFTLIEALVALVLFQVAALALAATTAVAARDFTVAQRHGRAQLLAQDRVARLRATACRGTVAGAQAHPGGIEERWTVRAEGAVREISDSVRLTLPGGRTRDVVVRAWERCGASP